MQRIIRENIYLLILVVLIILVIWQLPRALNKDCEVQKAKYNSWKNNESVLKNK